MLKKQQQQQQKPWKNKQKIYLKERYLMPRNKFHISTKNVTAAINTLEATELNKINK